MVHNDTTSSFRQHESINSFRQVCDKPCANRIIQAEWSPLRDLIAVITSNGEVRLHRMQWQKVWMLPAKDSHATSLAWKYNGRLLAVGYDNGDVQLIEIEKSMVVHSTSCNSRVTSLCWVAQKKADLDISYEDCSEKCLPEINKEELKKNLQYNNLNIGDDGQYSILVVGNNHGEVFLFIEGVYPALHLSVNAQLDLSTSSILCSHLSLETGIISVICKGRQNNVLCDGEMNDSMTEDSTSYYFHQFHSQLLSSHGPELSHLSIKFIKMRNTIELCGNVLKQMSDASEDVCLKINSKLEKLEDLVPDRTVASEFTLAYATGKISSELKMFLTQHLTVKGLKQIAQSVQSAYVSLRCDIGELDILTQQLLSHIFELRGMISWQEKFGLLGLSLVDVQQCIVFISQFCMKTQELLSIISSDMKNFAIFFSWLKNILCQAGGDVSQVSPFQLSNEDYDIMLDFLEYRLLKVEKPSGSSYDLERVSQYFKQGSLVIKSSTEENTWYNYVKENKTLNSSPFIMKPDTDATLQELYKRLEEHYNIIFNSVSACLSTSIATSLSANLYRHVEGHDDDCKSQFSFMKLDRKLLLSNVACTCDSDKMFMLDIDKNHLKLIGLELNNGGDHMNLDQSRHCQYTVRDVKFYNEEFLTVLSEEDDKSSDRLVTILGQVPLNQILDKVVGKQLFPDINKPILEDNSDLDWLNLNNHFSESRRMESFRGKQLSVNGYSRKVSSIVSLSGRRIRIFDMTAEDDEVDDSKIDDSKTDDSKIDDSKIENGDKLEGSSVSIKSEKDNTIHGLKIEEELDKVNISTK